jgi:hypothetical protein
MMDQQQEFDMGFTHEHFLGGVHICLIFDRDEERQKIVSEYMAAGLRQGEQVRYLTDTTPPETVHSWLLETGVELPGAIEGTPGPFSVASVATAYYPSGCFNPPEYIGAMPARFKRSKEAGYQGMRSCGEMTWTQKGVPGADRLMEYEVLLNTVQSIDYPFSGMCQYDARLFDGATLFNVLRVHPWMVVRGKIVQNPYYLAPQEFRRQFTQGL